MNNLLTRALATSALIAGMVLASTSGHALETTATRSADEVPPAALGMRLDALQNLPTAAVNEPHAPR